MFLLCARGVCGRGAWAGARGGGLWWHDEQDALAIIALNESIAAADIVEHLGPQAHVAGGAVSVARFGGDRSTMRARHLVE